MSQKIDKKLEMGKASTTGSFQLFIARIASTIMLAVSTILVGLFISDVDYGLYVIAVIPITTFLLFQDWGVGAALTKYCAQYRASSEEENLRKMIVAGLTFGIATGLVLSLLLLISANFMASSFLREPSTAYLITISSIAILFIGSFTISQSIFVGFERIKLVGVVIVCQAAIQFALSPLLVYMGYGALGVMLGYAVSQSIAGILSIVFLYFFIFKKLGKSKIEHFEIVKNLKILLSYGIPLALGLIITGLLAQFFSFVMANFCDTALIGHYKIAINFAVLITFFTTPIATVLFPAFSKINTSKDAEVLKSVFTFSVKYTSLFALPATVAMIVLSNAVIHTLYADKWFYSPLFLSLYLVQYLFISLGGATKDSLLQGLGKTKFLLKMRVLTLCTGIPLAILLIPQFEIVGLIFASLIASIPDLSISLYWIWKHYRVRIDFSSSAKILLACGLSGLVAYLFVNGFFAPSWINLLVGATLFLLVYLVSIPVIGAIDQTDLNNLRVMFSGLGFVSKLLEIPIVIIEFPLRFVAKRSNQKKSEADIFQS